MLYPGRGRKFSLVKRLFFVLRFGSNRDMNYFDISTSMLLSLVPTNIWENLCWPTKFCAWFVISSFRFSVSRLFLSTSQNSLWFMRRGFGTSKLQRLQKLLQELRLWKLMMEKSKWIVGILWGLIRIPCLFFFFILAPIAQYLRSQSFFYCFIRFSISIELIQAHILESASTSKKRVITFCSNGWKNFCEKGNLDIVEDRNEICVTYNWIEKTKHIEHESSD